MQKINGFHSGMVHNVDAFSEEFDEKSLHTNPTPFKNISGDTSLVPVALKIYDKIHCKSYPSTVERSIFLAPEYLDSLV